MVFELKIAFVALERKYRSDAGLLTDVLEQCVLLSANIAVAVSDVGDDLRDILERFLLPAKRKETLRQTVPAGFLAKRQTSSAYARFLMTPA